MYLKGSKWSVGRKSRQKSNPWRIAVLVILIAIGVYFNQVIVPTVPPLFMPTPTPTRSPESYVTDAEKLAGDGKTLLAIDAYREAIKANPKDVSLYLSASRLLVQTKQYTEALQMSENALLLNSGNSAAHALRGHILGYMDQYGKAEEAIKRAIELDPNNGIAHAYLAIVLILNNETGKAPAGTVEKAIEESRLALSLGSGAVETHNARGLVLEYTQNYAEAMQEFMQAVNMEPGVADYHMALGRNYMYLEQYDKAIEEFNKANALNPPDPDPDTYTSRTYLKLGEYPKAIQFAEQAIKDDATNPYMYGNIGLLYFRTKEYELALKNLTLAVQGGLNEEGKEVKGLPLDYGRIAEYYSNYGLTLSRLNMCTEALKISKLISDGVPKDQFAVPNAEVIVEICHENALATPTPKLTEVAATPIGPTAVPTGTVVP